MSRTAPAALLVLALLLLPGGASAYIPSAASLMRRAAARVNEGSRSKEVTLSGWLWVGDTAARAAQLTLRFPLSCRLESGKAQAQAQGSPRAAALQVKDDGLGAEASDLLRLACPLLAYRGQTPPQAEQTLRQQAAAAGVAPELAPTALARLYDRVAVVLGAQARQLDRPQLWLYKDGAAPARLLARSGDRIDDLRLLQYGNPAAGDWFPRVIELWRGERAVARFEVLETRGFGEVGGPSEDDDGHD